MSGVPRIQVTRLPLKVLKKKENWITLGFLRNSSLCFEQVTYDLTHWGCSNLKPIMCSILYESAVRNDIELLTKALEGGYGDLEPDELGEALMRAAKCGNEECVSLLLAHGADIDSQDLDGYSPLMYASANNYSSVVKILIKSGCDLDLTSERERCALHMAVWNNRVGIVKQLLRAECLKSIQDRNGDTPVMLCARRGCDKIMKYLLHYGCPAYTKNFERDTPLHYAAKYGNEGCMEHLLNYKPDFDLEDKNVWGFTPLLLAVMFGHTKSSMLLMGKGANIHVSDRGGKTLLHHAVKKNMLECVEQILARGGNPDVMDGDSNTPLTLAVFDNRKKLVKLLVQANCNVSVLGRCTIDLQYMWCTPLEVAILRGHFGVARMLVEAGCELDSVVNWAKDNDIPKILQQQPKLLEWILEIQACRPRLLDICRQALCQQFAYELQDKVTKLPLPTYLKQFLSFHTLDCYMDEE